MARTVAFGPQLRFYSTTDEEQFFAWLKAIPGVCDYHGVGRELDVSIDVRKLGRRGFDELIAIMRRYELDVLALRALDPNRSISWLSKDDDHWARLIFGDETPTS